MVCSLSCTILMTPAKLRITNKLLKLLLSDSAIYSSYVTFEDALRQESKLTRFKTKIRTVKRNETTVSERCFNDLNGKIHTGSF